MTIGTGVAYASIAISCAVAATTTGSIEAMWGLAIIVPIEFFKFVLTVWRG